MPDPPWLQGVEGDQVRPLITLDAPVLCVPSGPGTGKTFGLRRRVLRLLHPDGLGLAPSRVLVCAFNRVIAQALRDELKAELEPYGLELPVVRTIHGLAGELAGQETRFLLEHEVELMVYDILASSAAVSALFDGYTEAAHAMREYEAGLHEHEALNAAADTWLDDHGAALVGDLPRRVQDALAEGADADRSFDHVIVDEFQDLTETEARLAVGLRAADGQLMALGDRKQSIYGFRRNEERGLAALTDLVAEGVRDHVMDECRRCPKEIVELANAVMASYDEPLVDVRGEGAQIHQVDFGTPLDEHRRMAAEIVRAYQADPGGDHLVLVTRRKWGYELRSEIGKLDPDINAQTIFAEDILETWPAREAFIFLSIVASPTDPLANRDWIAYKQPDSEGKNWKASQRHAPVYAHLRQAGGLLSAARLREIADRPIHALAGSGRGEVHARAVRLRDLLDALPAGESPRAVIAHVLDSHLWNPGATPKPE
jgi:DNA helicase II / ATP-dependent DNA helicase PcrA